MSTIQPCPLPPHALLARYADTGYTDCYTAQVRRRVSQAEYIEAFYTGRLFKLERLLLALFVARPSTDAEAGLLASGEAAGFAAWRVEGRTADQLLMCDIGGRTRSWLMVSPAPFPESQTRLYFGSAVVPGARGPDGKARMGWVFGLLLGFHKLYSRALLASARSRLSARLAA